MVRGEQIGDSAYLEILGQCAVAMEQHDYGAGSPLAVMKANAVYNHELADRAAAALRMPGSQVICERQRCCARRHDGQNSAIFTRVRRGCPRVRTPGQNGGNGVHRSSYAQAQAFWC